MVKLIATCFYIGYLPLMPGTWASMAAVLVWYLLRNSLLLHLGLIGLVFGLGLWASTKAEIEFKKRDPKEIVIDEFLSQLLVFIFIPFNLINLVSGFLLFRIFDVFKLPPIKKLQNLPRGWGIMLDDIGVAIFVNLVLQARRFL